MSGELLNLTLETLKDLDGGRPALAFQHSVEQAVLDCKDRPLDNRPRKITLELILTPLAEESDIPGNFNLCGVMGTFRCKAAIPVRQTKVYNFGLSRQGKLFFSEQSPTNVAQTTIDEINPETGRVERHFKAE